MCKDLCKWVRILARRRTVPAQPSFASPNDPPMMNWRVRPSPGRSPAVAPQRLLTPRNRRASARLRPFSSALILGTGLSASAPKGAQMTRPTSGFALPRCTSALTQNGRSRPLRYTLPLPIAGGADAPPSLGRTALPTVAGVCSAVSGHVRIEQPIRAEGRR